jgi:hypothetical protein
MEPDKIMTTATSIAHAVKEIESITGKSVRTFRYEPREFDERASIVSMHIVFDFAPEQIICPGIAPRPIIGPE